MLKKEETEQEKHLRRQLEKKQKAQEKAKKVAEAKRKADLEKNKEPKKESKPSKILSNTFPQIPRPPLKKPGPPDSNSYLITSALPYVNNVPHLGNLIGCVLSADVYARFCRQDGRNTLYICGTDQFGTATQVKALIEKKTPAEVCDHFHQIHRKIYQWFDISFDFFGRTSTKYHQQITQQIFCDLKAHQFITQKATLQSFCESCSMFLADRYVQGQCPKCHDLGARGDQCDKCQQLLDPKDLLNPRCFVCRNCPVVKQTQHLYIDLPKIQEQTKTWAEQAIKLGEWDQNSVNITRAWMNTGLKQRCITRDLKWGIPVPLQDFKNKVFYVWFDAPIGYISITANYLGEEYKKWWLDSPAKLYQFMGKDNTPFHTVIFPSSLIGTRKKYNKIFYISTTDYLNYEDGKFSKSKNTGVFGDDAQKTGIESQVWRYYLLVNRPQKSDTVFTWSDFVAKNNNELLPNLGNLCNRVLKNVYSQGGVVPVPGDLLDLQRGLFKQVESLFLNYYYLLDKVRIKEGLKVAMQISSAVNKYIQEAKPWEKQAKDSGYSKTVLFVATNLLKFISAIFLPFMPSFSFKLNYLLGEKWSQADQTRIKQLRERASEQKLQQAVLGLIPSGRGIPQPIIIFREYSKAQQECWREQFKGKY